MGQFLRDPLVACIFGLLGACATLFVGLFLRPRRKLTVGVSSQVPLLDHRESRGRITVEFDGESVPQVWLTTICLKNSGNDAIKRVDFEEPFSIHLAEHGKLLSARGESLSPDDLPIELIVRESEIDLKPLMLNPGDKIEIRVLTTRHFRPKFLARIMGIRRLRTLGSADTRNALIGIVGTPCIAAMGILFSLMSREGTMTRAQLHWLLGGLWLLSFLLWTTYTFALVRRDLLIPYLRRRKQPDEELTVQTATSRPKRAARGSVSKR